VTDEFTISSDEWSRVSSDLTRYQECVTPDGTQYKCDGFFGLPLEPFGCPLKLKLECKILDIEWTSKFIFLAIQDSVKVVQIDDPFPHFFAPPKDLPIWPIADIAYPTLSFLRADHRLFAVDTDHLFEINVDRATAILIRDNFGDRKPSGFSNHGFIAWSDGAVENARDLAERVLTEVDVKVLIRRGDRIRQRGEELAAREESVLKRIEQLKKLDVFPFPARIVRVLDNENVLAFLLDRVALIDREEEERIPERREKLREMSRGPEHWELVAQMTTVKNLKRRLEHLSEIAGLPLPWIPDDLQPS
jgi:hypothetical protein